MPTLILKSVDGSALRIRVKEVPQSILTGSTAVSGALNLSSEGLFVQNNSGILEFKGLQAGSNITLTSSSTGITIASTGGGSSSGVTMSEFTGYTATTEIRLDDIEADIVYLSGQTDLKLNTSTFNAYTAATDSVIDNALTGVTVGTNLGVSQTGRVVHITFTGSTGSGDVTHAQLDPWTGATDTRLDDIEADIVYLSGVTASKVSTSLFNSYTGTTATELNDINADIVYLSGQTSSKLNTSLFNSYTGATATELSNINSELDLAITGVTAGANLSAIQTGRVVNITFTGSTGGGSITGATNLGTGNGVFAQVNGDELEFKSLVAGSNITLTPTSTGITIAASSGGGGSSYASGITFQTGGTSLTGTTVQDAIEELDDTRALKNATIVSLTANTTLDASYAGKIIECSGTFTVTFPNSMSTGMDVVVVNINTGIITLAASTTLSSKSSYTKLASQYSEAYVYHRGSNVWLAAGDLTP